MSNHAEPPAYCDIVDAALRLRGVATITPLLDCPAADDICGGRVLVKAEVLQRTGSFKFRGAYNLISRLAPEQRRNGVVAYSSGNHAQAVAAVARLLGLPATIVMPEDAPRLKIEATQGYGAEVVLYDRFGESREEIAAAIVAERGAVLVPPFDHPSIIAGQGTVGLEIVEQAAERNLSPDIVLVPCSGGGLVAGIATSVRESHPDASIYSVEPRSFDDTARSLRSGRRERAADGARSICDALLAPTPGELTFSINKRLLAGGLAVSDDMARDAMAFAFRRLKLVVEPGGAVALAAVLHGLVDCTGRTVVVVCSGGNVDASLYREVLGSAEVKSDRL
jgi:threonine dehydratase